MHPLDSAVYHTEYVMRHKGAPHLQQKYGSDLYWFQFFLLDVAALCAAVALAAIFVAYKLLKCCCSRLGKKTILAMSLVLTIAVSVVVKQSYS